MSIFLTCCFQVVENIVHIPLILKFCSYLSFSGQDKIILPNFIWLELWGEFMFNKGGFVYFHSTNGKLNIFSHHLKSIDSITLHCDFFGNFCFLRHSSLRPYKATFVIWHQVLTWNCNCGYQHFPVGVFSMQEQRMPTLFLCDCFHFEVLILLPQLPLLVHAFSDILLYLSEWWRPHLLPKWLGTLLLFTGYWHNAHIPNIWECSWQTDISHQPLWIALAVGSPFPGQPTHPITC